MQSQIFTISWVNIKSALVSGVLMAILGIAGYIVGIGNVFALDGHTLVNIGSMAFLTSLVSLVKSFLTDRSGDFVGAVEVLKEKKK